jgi:molecular chaperone DnaK
MHAQDDLKKKDLVEAKNIGEQLIYTAEKALKDAGDKVPADVKASVEEKSKALKDVLANTASDIEAIKKATVELSNETSKIGEAINKANASEPQKTGEANASTENVRDADFEEKKPEDQK